MHPDSRLLVEQVGTIASLKQLADVDDEVRCSEICTRRRETKFLLIRGRRLGRIDIARLDHQAQHHLLARFGRLKVNEWVIHSR